MSYSFKKKKKKPKNIQGNSFLENINVSYKSLFTSNTILVYALKLPSEVKMLSH